MLRRCGITIVWRAIRTRKCAASGRIGFPNKAIQIQCLWKRNSALNSKTKINLSVKERINRGHLVYNTYTTM